MSSRSQEVGPRDRVVGGVAAVVAGVVVVLQASQASPRDAPAWVGYAAGLAFVAAGLAILAQGRAARVQGWLGLLAVAGLFVPAAWVAFGAGPRECTVSLPFLSAVAPDLLCRGVFGLGAGLVAVLLVVGASRLVRRRRSG